MGVLLRVSEFENKLEYLSLSILIDAMMDVRA